MGELTDVLYNEKEMEVSAEYFHVKRSRTVCVILSAGYMALLLQMEEEWNKAKKTTGRSSADDPHH
jgi:hypothetical protein